VGTLADTAANEHPHRFLDAWLLGLEIESPLRDRLAGSPDRRASGTRELRTPQLDWPGKDGLGDPKRRITLFRWSVAAIEARRTDMGMPESSITLDGGQLREAAAGVQKYWPEEDA